MVQTITFLQSVDSCSLARAGTLETLSLGWARPNINPVSKGSVLGPVSISDKTSYRKISWNLETARLIVWIIASLWDFTGPSAAVLHRCLSNYIIIYQSRGFETSQDLTIRRLIGYWNRALGSPVSTSNKTSYCEILWSLEAARLVVSIIASLWNLTGSMSCL